VPYFGFYGFQAFGVEGIEGEIFLLEKGLDG
jgi:hypothetical protein